MPACRSCGAEIIWAETEKGKTMPVDLKAVDMGNIVLCDRPEGGTPPIAKYVKSDQETLLDEPRYVSHFATCPNAAEHRSAA